MLDDNGRVANHCLTARDSEDSFRMFACPPWPNYQAILQKMDIKMEILPLFILQLSGAKAKDLVEAAAGEKIDDLGFLEVRPIGLLGIDADLEVSRIGMSGTLTYEIRGDMSRMMPFIRLESRSASNGLAGEHTVSTMLRADSPRQIAALPVAAISFQTILRSLAWCLSATPTSKCAEVCPRTISVHDCARHLS